MRGSGSHWRGAARGGTNWGVSGLQGARKLLIKDQPTREGLSFMFASVRP